MISKTIGYTGVHNIFRQTTNQLPLIAKYSSTKVSNQAWPSTQSYGNNRCWPIPICNQINEHLTPPPCWCPQRSPKITPTLHVLQGQGMFESIGPEGCGNIHQVMYIYGVYVYTYYTYHTIPYHTTQHNAMQYNTIKYNTTQDNTTQHNTKKYNTIQHNTIQYITLHTVPYRTVPYRPKPYHTIPYPLCPGVAA